HWLKRLPDYQRRMDERQVVKLTTAIQNGEWQENGATIVFNEDGELIDGQHRLAAVIRSGKTIWSLVVRGVSSKESVFHTIGDEKPRRVTDLLRTANVNNVAAVARYLWLVEHGIHPIQ